jgi:hypothetical protein
MQHAVRAGLGTMLALAACGQPSPPVLTGHRPSGDPLGPEPTVRWAEHAIATTGLPAIARDGKTFVIAHRDSDGGRGNPNVTLIEKDREDQELRRFVVVTADDVDRLGAQDLELRFARAAGWLEERHADRHLVAMTALVTRPATDDAPAEASGAGVTVRWAPNHADLDRGDGAPVSRPTSASWLVPDAPLCPGCREVCHREPFLAGGFVDLERTAVIVVVAYRTTDTCWDPGSQEHVVAW